MQNVHADLSSLDTYLIKYFLPFAAHIVLFASEYVFVVLFPSALCMPTGVYLVLLLLKGP